MPEKIFLISLYSLERKKINGLLRTISYLRGSQGSTGDRKTNDVSSLLNGRIEVLQGSRGHRKKFLLPGKVTSEPS